MYVLHVPDLFSILEVLLSGQVLMAQHVLFDLSILHLLKRSLSATTHTAVKSLACSTLQSNLIVVVVQSQTFISDRP